jgi:hypothetical protein
METAARLTWHAWGDYAKHTFCGGCGQFLYCRQHRRRGRWLCLDCWDISHESDLLPVRPS